MLFSICPCYYDLHCYTITCDITIDIDRYESCINVKAGFSAGEAHFGPFIRGCIFKNVCFVQLTNLFWAKLKINPTLHLRSFNFEMILHEKWINMKVNSSVRGLWRLHVSEDDDEWASCRNTKRRAPPCDRGRKTQNLNHNRLNITRFFPPKCLNILYLALKSLKLTAEKKWVE